MYTGSWFLTDHCSITHLWTGLVCMLYDPLIWTKKRPGAQCIQGSLKLQKVWGEYVHVYMCTIYVYNTYQSFFLSPLQWRGNWQLRYITGACGWISAFATTRTSSRPRWQALTCCDHWKKYWITKRKEWGVLQPSCSMQYSIKCIVYDTT